MCHIKSTIQCSCHSLYDICIYSYLRNFTNFADSNSCKLKLSSFSRSAKLFYLEQLAGAHLATERNVQNKYLKMPNPLRSNLPSVCTALVFCGAKSPMRQMTNHCFRQILKDDINMSRGLATGRFTTP